jgi:EmrB/QacA subfamily drug resistance transporter
VKREPAIRKPGKNPWLFLLMVMGGVFLSTMDSGMVNIALPTIMRSFSVGLERTNLVVVVYLLTITATLVFWGKISDRCGKGKVYLLGVLVFAFGSVGCAFSSTFEKLLLSRFVQGIGASMMMSSGPAIIKAVFPPDNLGRSLGLVGIATACGLMSGPLVSGLLLTHFSWQSIFLVTVPFSTLIFLLGLILLKQLPEIEQETDREFDWKGSCCWALLVIVLIVLLNRLSNPYNVWNIFGGVIFAALLWLFIRVEKRGENPIIPIALVKLNYYVIAVVTATISFGALFVVLILVPFYLKYILQAPVDKIGFVIMALPVTLIVVSPLSGVLYDKIGGRFLTTTGLVFCTVALFSMAFLSSDSSLWTVAGNLALLGAGQSVFLTPNSASVLSRVSDQYAGITAGILATARNFGMVVGTTLATILFTFFLSYYGEGLKLEQYGATVMHQTSFMLALKTTFMITAAALLAGSLISYQRRS